MGLFDGFGGGSLFGSYSSGVVRNENKMFREMIKQSDTLAGEFLRIVDDAKDEFMEICTDGVVEMAIKKNENYKTSFEIKEEADRKIEKARKRYQERSSEFNKYLEELNIKINDLYEKKVELAKRINKETRGMPFMPIISIFTSAPSYSYIPSTVDMLSDYSGYRDVLEIRERKQKANEYLEDAKDFEVEISGKIAKINNIQIFLESVKMNIIEEKKLLLAVEDSMNRRKHLEYSKIAEQIHILISEYILDSNGQKNKKYMEAVEQLRELS